MRIPDEIKPSIELVAGVLRSLPSTTPLAVRTSVLEKLPRGVPKKLRPDVFGSIGGKVYVLRPAATGGGRHDRRGQPYRHEAGQCLTDRQHAGSGGRPSGTIERPKALRINAWTGEDAPIRTFRRGPHGHRKSWSPAEQDGWHRRRRSMTVAGITLKWDGAWFSPTGNISRRQILATAVDAPPAIQRLLASRPGSPVLRYRPDLQHRYLRRYYPNAPAQDLSVQAPSPGLGDGKMPQYLLIYGSPADIPWAVQYALNMSTYVGRLDLEGPALDNYVNALISDWQDQPCDPRAPVVWSVDHGSPDITFLMARSIAGRVWASLAADCDLTQGVHLNGDSATRAALGATLAAPPRPSDHDQSRHDGSTWQSAATEGAVGRSRRH